MARVYPGTRLILPSPVCSASGMIGAGVPGFSPDPGFSVSGSFVTGNTVTITGTGFGSKPNGAKPLFVVEPGLGVSALDPDSRGTWVTNWNVNSVSAQNSVAPNRTHSRELKYDDGGNLLADGMQMPTAPDRVYTFHRWMTNVDGLDLDADEDNYNFKFQRFWPLVGVNNLWDGVGQVPAADGNPRITLEYGSGSDYYQGNPNGVERSWYGLQKNKWVADEWVFYQGTVDASDATLIRTRDSVPYTAFSGASSTFIARTAANPNKMQKIYLGLPAGLTGTYDLSYKVFEDLWYCDDSWCRIYLSEESVWDSGTISPESTYEREPQIPLTWSDTELTFKVRTGVLGDPTGCYVWVTDSLNVAHRIGLIT